MVWLALKHVDEFICSFYVAFNSQGHIAMGSLQVEETSAYCNVNHRALASNCQLSNMKYPARDSNRRPQRLKARTLNCYTTEPPPQTCRFYLFIYLFGVLPRFQHCTGHITTGSWKGRGNQYIEFVRVLYCKLPTNGKQLPAFPLEAVPGIEPRPQRWEARVLSPCHHGPSQTCRRQIYIYIYI